MQFKWDQSLVTKEEIEKLFKDTTGYVKHLQEVSQKEGYEDPESSLALPLDEKLYQEIISLKEKFKTPNLKYILDIGIGGSNLGTKAVYDSLFGFFDVYEPNRFPKMIFLDTTDGEALSKILALLENLSLDEIAIDVISKSGGTTETTANFEIIFDAMTKRFPNAKDRFLVTTDFESKLWKSAKEFGIATLSLPKTVGGRYSVLSSVGLFPLALAGVDIKALREGALQSERLALSESLEGNYSFISAAVLLFSLQKGFSINDNFFFHPELESLGKWYRQLMGESIGKEENIKGEKKNIGITPTVSIGSTDLHSVGQLYLGGPKDKITTFISANSSNTINLPKLYFKGLVDSIEGKSSKDIMKAILEGIKIAYGKKHLPFMEIILGEIDERSLGEFLQFKMIEMMYLGKLLGVNAFDQPNVEDYKVETKKILTG